MAVLWEERFLNADLATKVPTEASPDEASRWRIGNPAHAALAAAVLRDSLQNSIDLDEEMELCELEPLLRLLEMDRDFAMATGPATRASRRCRGKGAGSASAARACSFVSGG